MERDNNLVKEFKEALAGFNALVATMKERVYDLNDDIEENLNIIEEAYNEIEADNEELREIAEATNASNSITEINVEATGILKDSDNVLDKMYALVEDGYINSEEYVLVGDDGDEVERDEEDDTDYVAPNTAENS